MKTLQVAIEDREWMRFGLTQERLSFAELEEMIHQAYAREAVAKCHDTKSYGEKQVSDTFDVSDTSGRQL